MMQHLLSNGNLLLLMVIMCMLPSQHFYSAFSGLFSDMFGYLLEEKTHVLDNFGIDWVYFWARQVWYSRVFDKECIYFSLD